MATSLILLDPKKPVNATVKEKFFKTIDMYILNEGMIIASQNPKIYVSMKTNITPTKLKNLVTTIKNTTDYNKVVKNVYYSTGLQKS